MRHDEDTRRHAWHLQQIKRLTRRLKPKQGRTCNERNSSLCSRMWGRDIKRVNGLDLIVKSPHYGIICQDCALADIATVLPLRFLKHQWSERYQAWYVLNPAEPADNFRISGVLDFQKELIREKHKKGVRKGSVVKRKPSKAPGLGAV